MLARPFLGFGGCLTRKAVAAVVGLLLLTLSVPGAGAAPDTPSSDPPILHTGPDYNQGRPLPFSTDGIEQFREPGDVAVPRSDVEKYAATAAGRNQIGARRYWFALDDSDQGGIYAKRFELRGKGDRVEVWVTPNLSFPGDDCRNDARVRVTDRQVRYLIRQFDNNIYPRESRVFSRPPRRNGSNAQPPPEMGVGPRYWRGQGDNIVVLVDNVRDANYYDANNSRNEPYIIGFFYSHFTELTDRNVMTIDGYDWIHRTRSDPPNEPDPGNLCESKPARPYLIEQTSAHEYQHLLHYYQDRNETTWLNEGLSDWAQTVTGYAFPERTVEEYGFDRHVQCFLGYCSVQTPYNTNPADMGPENSLTLWEDQSGEILAEYGATYTFSELLASRYGRGFMRGLHRRDANGLRSVARQLREIKAGTRIRAVVRDWAAAMAVDRLIDDGAILTGRDPDKVTARRLSASINWATSHAYDTPGAPPNGSDYVRLRDAGGNYLSAGQLESLTFNGMSPSESGRFELQLVAYDSSGTTVTLRRVRLDAQSDATLTREELIAELGTTATTVSAIVTFFDPTESVRRYADYRLTVNGVQQPGGS